MLILWWDLFIWVFLILFLTGPAVHQIMGLCEASENNKPGQMIIRIAFDGSTTDEIRFIDDKFTYQGIDIMSTLRLEIYKWYFATVHYPHCSTALRKYLKKRTTQGKRRGKQPLCFTSVFWHCKISQFFSSLWGVLSHDYRERHTKR